MVNIKKIGEKLSYDEMTVKSVLEGFFKGLSTEYKNDNPFSYLLNKCNNDFNSNYSVSKFEDAYYNDEFHPIIKEYINELVEDLISYAKRHGAGLYKPFWEDTDYYEGMVRERSDVGHELKMFCNIVNASDEVLTAIFNITLEKLTEQGIAWGSMDACPEMCSDEPFYIDGKEWIFRSYEDFKKIISSSIMMQGEFWDYELYDEIRPLKQDIKIVCNGEYDYGKVSALMNDYLTTIVKMCEWVGNDKLEVYATKFELELAGFGNGYEDDYLEFIEEDIMKQIKSYTGHELDEDCKNLLRTSESISQYCCLKYEKTYDELTDDEQQAVLEKVRNI